MTRFRLGNFKLKIWAYFLDYS